MSKFENIETLLSQGKGAEALPLIAGALAADPDNALLIYLRGKAYWQLGQRANAITDYEHAAQLDPSSPAVQALEMSRDIMDFFNPDIFNP